jgi:hypothetical protein
LIIWRFNTMLKRLLTVTFMIVALAGVAGTSQAQYMWMDSNGDGVNTAADVMQANGVPTTVDVWVNTSHNRDGSLAECNSADGDLATWNSFATHINVQNGTATFTGYTNRVAAFTIACAAGTSAFVTNNTTEMGQCQATGSPTPNGGVNIRMYTVTVTGTSGSPSLIFVPLNNQDGNFTSFGTACSGNDFDNTYKLGSDFFDHDGIGPGGPPANAAPIISAPATVNGAENSPVSVTANATDPDAGQLVTLSQTNNAPFLAGPASAGPVANPSITLSGTPNFSQAGTYAINWHAVDNAASPLTDDEVTNVTIANVDRAPVVTAPATATGAEGV